MSNLRQAAQSFVDCWDSGHFFTDRHAERIRALRAALAQPEQEPVAWAPQVWRQFRSDGTLGFQKIKRTPNGEWEDYTAPPKRDLTCVCGAVWEGEMMVYPPRKREWVGLTDDEADELVARFARYELLRKVEAKLKDKNV